MVTISERDTPDLLVDLFIGALRVKDTRLNAIASELLVRFGKDAVPRLVLAAANPKNRPSHRVRLLEAIGRVGVVADPGSYFDLFALSGNKNAEVRRTALGLMSTLQQRRCQATLPVTAR